MRPLRLLCLLCLFLPASLHAQLGVYGKFDFVHDNDVSDSGASAVSGNFNVGGAGVYDDFLHLGPVRAGVDFRGDLSSGGQYDYRAFLGGVRAGFKVPLTALRPYVQFSAGGGGTKYTGALAAGISSAPYSTKFLYEILGGVDYTLIPHVDLRAIEIGVGRQSAVVDTGSGHTATLLLVSSGVALRF